MLKGEREGGGKRKGGGREWWRMEGRREELMEGRMEE